MRIMIMGGGKLGYYLSRMLMEKGNDVLMIEKDKRKCIMLADELDSPVIYGDGTKVETLADASLAKYDVFIAVAGKDQDNMVACELAKKRFNVKKTIARVNNPKNIDIMKKTGTDIAVSNTGIIAGMIEHEVDSTQAKLLANINRGEAEINEYTLPKGWSNKGISLKELDLPNSCVIVTIVRGEEVLVPRGDTRLYSNDEIIALTMGNARKQLLKIFEIS